MKKQDIISAVTPELYTIECEAAWKVASFTGGRDVALMYSSDLPFTISQLIWEAENGLSSREKIELMFDIYVDLPCYTLLSEVYIHQYRAFSEDALLLYWHSIRAFLSQDTKALVQPIIYSLAVDFFEDINLREDSWWHLVTPNMNNPCIRNVLAASCAIPYALKNQLYQQLLPIQSWHDAIYMSLYGSYYGVYGEIDKLQARVLLDRLMLSQTDTEYTAFRHALEQGERYANYFVDRRSNETMDSNP
jgi:hypothetical protein